MRGAVLAVLFLLTVGFGQNKDAIYADWEKPNTIEAHINLPKEIPPDKVLLFIRDPFDKPIQSVKINGKDWYNWDNNNKSIVLPSQEKTIDVIVSY